ncbi:MAG: hypothetical protein SX243_05385 [Acidobacteriota bacterium]|nr:hypothetical protein [Acidobacteriota bacterium]
MPVVLIPFALIALFFAILALIAILFPLGIFNRYRVATSRRKARGCLALANSFAFALSASTLLATAAVTSVWEPRALPYVGGGFVMGGLLGWLSLAISRWEETADGLYVTARRWLVLTLILVVVGRFGYGIWRAWNALVVRPEDESWLVAAGIAGSLAAGALIIGYSLVYWLGVRRRVRRYRRRQSL